MLTRRSLGDTRKINATTGGRTPMLHFFQKFAYSTRRYTAAIALAAAFISCAQTPTAPSTIETTDENGAVITTQAVPVNGLKGDYYNNIDFTGTLKTRYDATINSNWKTAAPITGIAATTYSVRWTGQIQPAYTEEYTFSLTSSGQARLMINGVVLVNNWVEHASKVDTGKVSLQAGTKYDIRLEYARSAVQPALVKLEWQSARRTKQVVPNAALFSSGSNLEAAIRIVNDAKIVKNGGTTVASIDSFSSLRGSRQIIVTKPIGKSSLFIGLLKDNVVAEFIEIRTVGSDQYIKDYRTGMEVNFGDYKKFQATLSESDTIAFAENAMRLAIVDRSVVVYKPTAASSGMRTQGFLLPELLKRFVGVAPSCSQCQVYAERYRDAVVNFIGGLQELPIAAEIGAGSALGQVLNAGLGTSISVDGMFSFFSGREALPETWQQYLDCIGGFMKGVSSCPPILEGPIPNPIEMKARLNSTVSIGTTLKNIGKKGEAGLMQAYYDLVTSDNIYFLFEPFAEYRRKLIPPEESGTIFAEAKCPSTAQVLTGTFKIVHNAQGGYVDVPIKIICADEPKLVVTPSSLEIVAAINSEVVRTLNLENKGDGELTYITSFKPVGAFPAGASITPTENSSGHIIAGANKDMKVSALCGSTVGTLLGAITISSNDPSSPTTVNVTLECISGSGVTAEQGHIAGFHSEVTDGVVTVSNILSSSISYTASISGDDKLQINGSSTGVIPAKSKAKISLSGLCRYTSNSNIFDLGYLNLNDQNTGALLISINIVQHCYYAPTVGEVSVTDQCCSSPARSAGTARVYTLRNPTDLYPSDQQTQSLYAEGDDYNASRTAAFNQGKSFVLDRIGSTGKWYDSCSCAIELWSSFKTRLPNEWFN
jgi:PA14 domain